MNQLIIRLPRRWWYPPLPTRVTVSGFATTTLHAGNAYMEWLLPAGAYTVLIENGSFKQAMHYQLQAGEKVDIEWRPPALGWWQWVWWIGLLVGGSVLLLATLWWELMHEYYAMAAGTLLVAVAVVLRVYGPWRSGPGWRVQQHSLHTDAS